VGLLKKGASGNSPKSYCTRSPTEAQSAPRTGQPHNRGDFLNTPTAPGFSPSGPSTPQGALAALDEFFS
jgi:hypothetical protein